MSDNPILRANLSWWNPSKLFVYPIPVKKENRTGIPCKWECPVCKLAGATTYTKKWSKNCRKCGINLTWVEIEEE